MPNITYNSNNSGGDWWLTDQDWRNLEAAGWQVKWSKDETWGFSGQPLADKNGRWLGALAAEASKDFPSVEEAVTEWTAVVGQDPDEEGCPCCGPPHNFYEDD